MCGGDGVKCQHAGKMTMVLETSFCDTGRECEKGEKETSHWH